MKKSAGIDARLPPLETEIEVSIFGPGFGECIVVHLGFSDWIIIDSCVRPDAKTPVALEYLKDLGVATGAVKLVVATHWHDDHMRGLGSIFRSCQNAKFACSVALKDREWTSLVETYGKYALAGGSGLDEIRWVMQELQRRANNNEIVAPKFAISKLPLFERHDHLSASLIALSPSNAAVATFQADILKRLQPQALQRRLRVPEMGQNDGSIVLDIRVGEARALLGADLEEHNIHGLGWQVILDEHDGPSRPFEGFKVPHHGSKNGHHSGQWETLLKPDAWAAITPYNRGKKLPTKVDCQRILKCTPRAYITASPEFPKFRHNDKTVQKTMVSATRSIGEELTRQGHIRFRRIATDPKADWRVELFGEAMHLEQLVFTLETV